MKKTLKIIAITLIAIFGLIYISGYKYLLSAFGKIYLTGHTTAYLDDYKRFDNRTVAVGDPQPWPLHADYNTTEASKSLETYHANTSSVAFLVVKNDSLFYEKYYEGYGVDSNTNSFSMAKSMVSAMLGKAIMEGAIESLDHPVKDFIPELQGAYADKVTVGDLSSMSSGMVWDESYYSAFSVTTAAYFKEDLAKLILEQPIDLEPGKAYIYKSGATQLLGMVVQEATGKSLSNYLSESFWQPMGAEDEAYWQLDSEEYGLEKAYCCFASNARDFARFGKLYKDYGKWGEEQILDSLFVAKSLTPRFEESPEYGYGWWLETYKGQKVFMMRGHLGQYVIVFPEKNIIAVRLGHSKGEAIEGNPYTEDIYVYMDATLEMTGHAGAD